MRDQILPNSWNLQMKEGGTTTILAGIQQQIDIWRLIAYLERRDKNKAQLVIPRPPRWPDTITALAAQALHRVKLILDKHRRMGDQVKVAQTAVD